MSIINGWNVAELKQDRVILLQWLDKPKGKMKYRILMGWAYRTKKGK